MTWFMSAFAGAWIAEYLVDFSGATDGGMLSMQIRDCWLVSAGTENRVWLGDL